MLGGVEGASLIIINKAHSCKAGTTRKTLFQSRVHFWDKSILEVEDKTSFITLVPAGA